MHKLYPEEDKSSLPKIKLYPPMRCEHCGKEASSVEWREFEVLETHDSFIGAGSLYNFVTKVKKLCHSCFLYEKNPFIWG